MARTHRYNDPSASDGFAGKPPRVEDFNWGFDDPFDTLDDDDWTDGSDDSDEDFWDEEDFEENDGSFRTGRLH